MTLVSSPNCSTHKTQDTNSIYPNVSLWKHLFFKVMDNGNLINFVTFFTEIWHKIKVNTKPVCIGTKNDSFGVFYSPFNASVKSFEMVHISGGVAWGGELQWRGRWGDLLDNHIELHITNSKNKRLAPPENYTMEVPDYLRYNLPGQSNNATNITLPEFKPRLRVFANEEFRIWYGQDLVKRHEEGYTSHGTTCKDVYMEYRDA